MTQIAIDALLLAVKNRLNIPGQPWGARVYPYQAPAKTPYPYVVIIPSGGGERNQQKARDAEIVMVVKVVSDKLGEAFAAASAVDGLLNDHGAQETSDALSTGSSEWSILTATGEEAISYLEMFANVTPVYHAGARYRFVMEASR